MLRFVVEGRTKLHGITADNKTVYTFEVPTSASLGELYDIVTQYKEELWKRLEENKKAEDKKKKEDCCKEECKTGLHEKKEEPKKEPKKDLRETLLVKNKK